MAIVYKFGNDLTAQAVIDLLNASTLGVRRPVDAPLIISRMIAEANLVVTAWDNERLIGLARTLTDFAYVGYLSDLAVHVDYQLQGIGVELISHTRSKMGPRSTLVLLAAPKAEGYYPKIGFTKHNSAWILKAGDPLRR